MNKTILATLIASAMFASSASANTFSFRYPIDRVSSNGAIENPGNNGEDDGSSGEDGSNGEDENGNENLGPWEQFAQDNNLPYSDWHSLNWSYENLTSIPTDPYPLTSPTGVLNFNNNSINNIQGLRQITSIGSISLLGNNIFSLAPLANMNVTNSIYINSNYSGMLLSASTVFCQNNDASQFFGAPKTAVCEAEDITDKSIEITSASVGYDNGSGNYYLNLSIQFDNVSPGDVVDIAINTGGNTINTEMVFENTGGSTTVERGASFNISSIFNEFHFVEVIASNSINVNDSILLNNDVILSVVDTIHNTSSHRPEPFLPIVHSWEYRVLPSFKNLNINSIDYIVTEMGEYNSYAIEGSIYLNSDGSISSVSSASNQASLQNGWLVFNMDDTVAKNFMNPRITMRAFDVDGNFVTYGLYTEFFNQ